MTTRIYGSADVAADLGVSKSVVSNWLARYGDYPTPDFETPTGRYYWLDLDEWRRWFEKRGGKPPEEPLREMYYDLLHRGSPRAAEAVARAYAAKQRRKDA